jgi:hypothetical protein
MNADSHLREWNEESPSPNAVRSEGGVAVAGETFPASKLESLGVSGVFVVCIYNFSPYSSNIVIPAPPNRDTQPHQALD